ncbi:MAG: glycoside hydrolase family 65 protein, partial [Bacteroidota bacterium]
MIRLTIKLFLLFSLPSLIWAQNPDPWRITASDINPARYFGISVANGMLGLVSSPEPMQASAVVLNGIYDNYQRGRVSNILQVFDPVSMVLQVDGTELNAGNIKDFRQSLDMRRAVLQTDFAFGERLNVKHELMALRHLPHTALAIITLEAKEDVDIQARSLIKAPDHLREVRNTFATIDRPHVTVPLLTSVGQSPTGVHTVAASNSIIFP